MKYHIDKEEHLFLLAVGTKRRRTLRSAQYRVHLQLKEHLLESDFCKILTLWSLLDVATIPTLRVLVTHTGDASLAYQYEKLLRVNPKLADWFREGMVQVWGEPAVTSMLRSINKNTQLKTTP